MAEAIAVVGLIGSIVNIIDGIHKSKALWKQYVHSSASLRLELLPVLGKLSAFAGILRGLQLQYDLDEADANRLRTFEYIEEPLKASEQAVRLISARLNQIISIGRTSFSFGKVLDKDTTAALHILDQAKPVLDLALTTDQITLAKSIETYVRNVAEELRDFRQEGNLFFDHMKEQLAHIAGKATDDDEAKQKAEILAWISDTNYISNYEAARQPSPWANASGNWFIAGDDLQNWISNSNHARLLLTGISGSGKTVLCAKAIEYLAQRNDACGSGLTILYFFFDFNDAAKESVEGMVRALLAQLVLHITSVPDDIQVLYEKHRELSAPKLSVQTWVALLSTHLMTRQDTYVFIDALDECTEEIYLREILNDMCSTTDVRWLLTSRPNEKVVSGLSGLGFEHMSMNSNLVAEDIETYLTVALKADPKFESFSNVAKGCIIEEITRKSDGMFRYAQCQLEVIANLRDRRIKKVKSVLKGMPRTIAESYERILTGAQQLDNWPIVENILLLTSFSTRPVTVAEVAEFAIIEDDMESIDVEDRLDISGTLAAINTLITVRDGVVTLAHKSVQDFFTEGSRSLGMSSLWQNADVYIGKRCLQYLGIFQEPVRNIPDNKSTKEPNTTQLRRLIQHYSFLDYAATCWQRHLQEKQHQLEVLGYMASTLPLTTKPNLWKAWLSLQRGDIWENQILLAGILSESFIRGTWITNWSLNFWQQRQQYRIRSDAGSLTPSKRLLNVGDERSHAPSKLAQPKSLFWVRATKAQSLTPSILKFLAFQEGDLILIVKTGRTWWQGVSHNQTGEVDPLNVERCDTYTNEHLSGQLFHELAILLLEVSLQSPLATDAMMLWTQISSASQLSQYLAKLKELIKRAEGTMGSGYGNIIKYCLSNVFWMDRGTFTNVPDVADVQEFCMERIHAPMVAIRATGFRASRRRVKRKVDALNHSWQAPSGNYVSTNTYASEPNHSTVEFTGDYHVGSLEGPTTRSVPMLSYRAYPPHATIVNNSTSYSTNELQSHPYGQISSSMIYPALRNGRMTSRMIDEITNASLRATTGVVTATAVATSPQYSHLFTSSIDLKKLSWENHNLVYSIFPDHQERPPDIQSSDDEMTRILEANGESIRENRHWPTEISWASDVLNQVSVMNSNNARTARAFSMQISSKLPAIGQDAVNIVRRLADIHPDAMYLQAQWWETGKFGYTTDKVKSLERYQLAAEKGHVAALYKAAVLLNASGDLVEGRRHENLATDAGHPGALLKKALNTIEGIDGEAQDLPKAIDLAIKAAEMADKMSGQIVDEDKAEAFYHAGLIFACETHYFAGLGLGRTSHCRDTNGLPEYERAVEYFRKAAFCGSSKAQLRLGTAYELTELGLPHSVPLALHYYILAARRGEAKAEMGISKIIMSHTPGDNSPLIGAAYTYAKRATLDNDLNATFALGYFHEHGLHVAVNKEKALEWYEEAAEKGHSEAKYRVTKLKASKLSWPTNMQHPDKHAAHGKSRSKESKRQSVPPVNAADSSTANPFSGRAADSQFHRLRLNNRSSNSQQTKHEPQIKTEIVVGCKVRALCDFVPVEPGDLQFQEGDIIIVKEQVYQDWWRGSLNGQSGLFPANYVEIVNGQDH